MRKAGVQSYEKFARELLSIVKDLPVSLEVFDDEFSEMERQALIISSWGKNVNVKIPITNTRGECQIINWTTGKTRSPCKCDRSNDTRSN